MSRKKVQQLTLREAWRVERGFDGDHPGYYPGSPEDVAHREAEKERRARSEALWAANPRTALVDTSEMERAVIIRGLERSIQRRFDRCCHRRKVG